MPNIPDEIKKETLKDMEPLGDNLYIYVLPRVKKMGSIELPEAYKQHTEMAIVITIGKDVKELKPGDRILISYHMGVHLQIGDTYTESSLHRIIVEHNVLSKIGENNALIKVGNK